MKALFRRSHAYVHSLSGRLNLVLGVTTLAVAIGAFIIIAGAVTWGLHRERANSIRSLGTSLSALVARPFSLGDFFQAEDYLRSSFTPPFVTNIRLLSPDGEAVAVGKQGHATGWTREETFDVNPVPTKVTDNSVASAVSSGRLVLEWTNDDLVREVIIFIGVGLAALAVALAALSQAVRRTISFALTPLNRAIERGLSERLLGPDFLDQAPDEVRPLLTRLQELHEHSLRAAAHTAIAQTAQTIAHDLRMPLWNLEQLAGAASWEDFQRLKKPAASALGRIFTHIEAFRRMDIEKIIERTWQHLDLTGLLHELGARCVAQGAELTCQISRDLKVHLDMQKIERVISNLVTNAAEAGATAVTLAITATELGTLDIVVQDNGPGVPAVIESQLFTMGATSGKETGTGLGLHYVRSVARGHGGDVTYTRQDGQSTFRIEIPHAVDEPTADVAQIPVTPAKLESLRGGTPRRALALIVSKNEPLVARLREISAGSTDFEVDVGLDTLDQARLVYTDDIDVVLTCAERGVPAMQENNSDTAESVFKAMSMRLRPLKPRPEIMQPSGV